MNRRIALTAIAIVTLAVAPRAQVPGATEASIIKALEGGSLNERATAVAAVVHARAGPPSGDLIVALANELSRMNGVVSRRRSPAVAPSGSEWDTAGVGEYYGDLIQANTLFESDATMIALTGALQTGRMATNAVAAYGASALPLVMRLFGDGVADVGERNGAGRAIERMLLEGRLDAGLRRQVESLVGAVLARPEHVIVVMIAVDVAVATKEPGLMAIVRRLADNPSAAQLDGRFSDDTRARGMLQVRARKALGR